MAIIEKIPILGKEIKGLRNLIESQNAYMAELEEDVKDWQAVAKQAEEKDVDWTDYVKNHKDAWEAYVENPLAKGYVDRLTDFVVKDGFQVASEDEKTQKAIDELTDVPEWLSFQVQVCRELGIYGEIFDRFFGNGLAEPKTTLVDPSTVKVIETDPEDVNDIKRYFIEYKVIEYDEQGNITKSKTETDWIDAEEIIHLKTNTVSTANRGISDLLCVLKWLTRHKEVATNLVRRTNIMLSIVGEKIIKGPGIDSTTVGGWKKSGDDATSAETGKRTERTIKPGTWLVHSQHTEYKITELKNDIRGMTDLLKMLNKIICAGLGLSEHWLGDTSESNLATATSVEIPIMAKFERRQNELKDFFHKHVTKWLSLVGIEDAEFEVTAPEISAKDAVAFASAIKTLAEGLVVAVDNRWISDESAAKTLGDYLDQFESFDDEQEKIKNLELVREKEKPTLIPSSIPPQPGVTPPQLAPYAAQTEDAALTAKFQQAFAEAKEELHKAAMDGIILDYAKTFSDAFIKARAKVMKGLKDRANERREQGRNE